ncbi:putative ABC-type xenobiotic transporter [Microsporum audouinii]
MPIFRSIKQKLSRSNKHEDREVFSLFRVYGLLWRFSTSFDVLLQILGTIAAIGAGTTHPLMTLVFGQFVNIFNNHDSSKTGQLLASVNSATLYFVYLFLAKAALIYVHTVCFTISAARITASLRKSYLRTLLAQDVVFFDSRDTGAITTIISQNAEMVQNGLSERLGMTMQAVSMFISGFIIGFVKSWKLTIVTSTSIPALAAATFLTLHLDMRIQTRVLEIQAQAGILALETLKSMKIVTAFSAVEKLARRYSSLLATVANLSRKRGPYIGAQYSVDYCVLLSAYALAFWYGVVLVEKGEIASGGIVVTVILCINQATTALMTLVPSLGEVSKAAAAARDLLSTIQQRPKEELNSLPRPLKASSGELVLNEVHFSYPARPEVPVLNGVTLRIMPGKRTAIVGPSGSGKSTIVGLIERWYDPDRGSVTLDGVDIRTLPKRWLRKQLGLVQQEPALFNDTIFENVRYGLLGSERHHGSSTEEEDRSRVREACMQVGIHDFIETLPKGYDTKVGERGDLLSGGQRQRVAIARCIISNPDIMLLDEATAALDPASENIVQAALDLVCKNRTTVVVAHKLSTIKSADQIVVMDHGKIMQQGDHETLRQQDGIYKQMISNQDLDIDDEPGVDEESADVIIPAESETMSAVTPYQEKSEADIEKPNSSITPTSYSILQILSIIFSEQRKSRFHIIVGIIACFAAGAVYPVQAIFFAKMVTVFSYSGEMRRHEGEFWSGMFFMLAVSTLISYAFVGHFFTVTATKVIQHYQSQYFLSMLKQDLSYFQRRENAPSVLASHLATNSERLQNLLGVTLGLILIVLVDLVSSSILSLVVGWKISLVVLFGSLPPMLAAGYGRIRLENHYQDQQKALFEESTRYASEAISGIKAVFSLAVEDVVYQRYEEKLYKPLELSHKQALVSMSLFALVDSIYLLSMGLAFWYGGKLLLQGEYNSTQFFIVFTAIISGGQAAAIFFGYTGSITKARGAANRMFQLRDTNPVINGSTGSQFPESKEDKDMITFSNVEFRYHLSDARPALRGLNFSIRKGEKIALVGPSGSGKSTIVSLLERFYDATSGCIFINGQPLQSIDVSAYRSKISLVSQETHLYQGTIRDNLLLGIPSESQITDAEITQAAQDANIHDFIISLPEGYQTVCGVGGANFSGGQRQRIAIARALLCDPAILLLDEATSALDSTSEQVVQQALEKAAAGRTTISVAHRLSTIRNSNTIFVLVEGQIREKGTHKELIQQQGIYYKMCQAQALGA